MGFVKVGLYLICDERSFGYKKRYTRQNAYGKYRSAYDIIVGYRGTHKYVMRLRAPAHKPGGESSNGSTHHLHNLFNKINKLAESNPSK
jgi:hypothetical protein